MSEQVEKPQPLRGSSIGFIGLGNMGLAMAARLAEAGAELHIWNRSVEKALSLQDFYSNVTAEPSPKHVAERADIIITILTDAAALSEVLFDPENDRHGLHHGLDDTKMLIDMGTTAVDQTREIAAKLRLVGAAMVDAPVSGGTTAAASGTLSIMAGGSDVDFVRALPLFRVLGRRMIHVGPIGAGQIAKTANQMIVGMTIGAVAEALALAKRAGADPALVREAITGGFADSRILELHGERMVSGDLTARATGRIQLKDMTNAAKLAEQSGVSLDGLDTNLQLWQRMIEHGFGDLDHSALILEIDPQNWQTNG